MKKFFAIAVIAASFVACNNSGEKKEGETKDTTVVAPDTTVVAPDTTTPVAPDTTVVAAPDTTKK